MASNETVNANPSRGRVAWAAAAVVLVLAVGGGWLLNRPTAAPAPTAGAAAASDSGRLEPLRTKAKAQAAAAPLPAAAPVTVTRPSLPMPTTSSSDELRKVRLALEGNATAGETLDAAKLLSACQGADATLKMMYWMRDQPAREGQQVDQATGASAEQIARQEDLGRRCQVFDTTTVARQGELLKRAYEGGAKDAVLRYLQWLNSDGKHEANPELLGKLQRDARQIAEDGDIMALTAYSYAFDLAPLGVTPMQRQAYKEALFQISREMSGAASEQASRASMADLERTMSQWGLGPPALSAAQQREADALTERVVDAWRKLHGRGS